MDYFVSLSFPLSFLIHALGHRQNVTSFEISILYPPEVEMAVWKQKQRKNIEISKLNMFSHLVVSDSVSPWTVVCQAPLSTGILQARILEWVAMHPLQGIVPIQGSNPGLPHCRQILYCLSHQGSPRISALITST